MSRFLRPAYLFVIVGLYYVFAWVLIIAIDGLNIFGLQDYFIDTGIEHPLLWVALFREASPTEIIAWIILGAGSITFAWCAARYSESNVRLKRFCLLMSIGTLLMLIEDAGNPSHRVAGWFATLSLDFQFNPRLFVFIPIAFFPVCAVIKYGKDILALGIMKLYLIGGLAFYGLAVFISVVWDNFAKSAGLPVRSEIGAHIHTEVLRERLILPGLDLDLLGWQLMDYVVEESLEFFGATLLLATALYLYQRTKVCRDELSKPGSSLDNSH